MARTDPKITTEDTEFAEKKCSRVLLGVLGVLCGFVLGCSSAPSGPDIHQAKAYFNEGKSAAEQGNHAGAVDLYSKAILENPEYSEAYYLRGYSNIRLRLDPDSDDDPRARQNQALHDFSMALRINPALAEAYYNRAMILASRAQFKQAVEDLLNASRCRPNDLEAHLALGELYEKYFEDRIPQAMAHYEKYAELGGADPKVLEKVRVWKELKKQIEPPSKAPTAEDEKKAEELYENFKRLFADHKKEEALKTVEEILSKYGHTQFVQKRAREMNALLNALKK